MTLTLMMTNEEEQIDPSVRHSASCGHKNRAKQKRHEHRHTNAMYRKVIDIIHTQKNQWCRRRQKSFLGDWPNSFFRVLERGGWGVWRGGRAWDPEGQLQPIPLRPTPGLSFKTWGGEQGGGGSGVRARVRVGARVKVRASVRVRARAKIAARDCSPPVPLFGIKSFSSCFQPNIISLLNFKYFEH